MTDNTPPAGWYPDPTGAAQQRYWDGQQWTEALAAPTVIHVPVAAPPTKDWFQRHPAWTTLIVFWVACMIWQWEWLVPVIVQPGFLPAPLAVCCCRGCPFLLS